MNLSLKKFILTDQVWNLVQQWLFDCIELILDLINLLIYIFRHIESVFKDIVHLTLELVFEIIQLPSLLLNLFYLFSFSELVRGKILLNDRCLLYTSDAADEL